MIDPNRIADLFMAIVLVLMAAINMHTYIRKGRYKDSGWLSLTATIISIISATWIWFKY